MLADLLHNSSIGFGDESHMNVYVLPDRQKANKIKQRHTIIAKNMGMTKNL